MFGQLGHNATSALMLTPTPVLMQKKRVRFFCCGPRRIVAVVGVKLPSWGEIKPFLVGWLKDQGCYFHHSKGITLDVIQLIIELTFEIAIPTLRINQ